MPGRQSGLIVIRARISGPSGNVAAQLAVDTGAVRTLISREVLQHAGYRPASATQRVLIATASGIERVPQIVVERIQVLGHQRRNVPVLAHTLPPSVGLDGLLGLDFLRDYRLTIDFRAGTVTLE